MFNNQTKEDKMFNTQKKEELPKKVWLVIEKNVYGSTQSFSVIKNHQDIEEAMKFKIYLEALNDRKHQTYFLASDVDTVMNRVITSHNKSVKEKEVA